MLRHIEYPSYYLGSLGHWTADVSYYGRGENIRIHRISVNNLFSDKNLLEFTDKGELVSIEEYIREVESEGPDAMAMAKAYKESV